MKPRSDSEGSSSEDARNKTQELDELWALVEKSLTTTAPLEPNANAYLQWVKWLRLLENASDAGDVLLADRYWHYLQEGLRAPSAEQRKYCLYILSKSICVLDTHITIPRLGLPVHAGGKVELIDAYERFCTLFSTFVLDRYINQVQDSISDLAALAAPGSTVHLSWVIILLEAALQHGVQDSVRRSIGTFVLNWDTINFLETDVWSNFLTLSFLPWACQGTLFTSSVTGHPLNEGHICQHGEELSLFVCRLFRSGQDQSLVSILLHQILMFIKDKGQKLVSFAAGSYLLDGCLSGLRSVAQANTTLGFTQQDLDVLVDIADQTGLPEVARDFHITRCAWIIRLLSKQSSADTGDDDKPPEHLEYRGRSLELTILGVENLAGEDVQIRGVSESSIASSTPNGRNGTPSYDNIFNDIEESKHKCLSGHGVISALVYVRDCLELDKNANADTVHQVLMAIWSEIELQDYPKTAMMEVTTIFFDKNVLLLTNTESQLLKFLADRLYELQRFSEGRVYLISSLTLALRRLYFEAPDQAVKLPLLDFFVRFAYHPPTAKPEFLLESALVTILQQDIPFRTYEAYYGPREGIGSAAVIDILNNLRPHEQELGSRVIDRLLEPWLTTKAPVPMVSKTKTTQQLQTILILLNKFARCKTSVEKYLRILLELLAVEPMPRFRYIMEWIITILISKHTDYHESLVEPLEKPEHDNPKYLASLIKVAVHAAQLPVASEEFGLRLMTAMVATCASPKISVRHESQWSFLILWDHAQNKSWQNVVGNVAFTALNNYIRCLGRYTNPPPQRLLESFEFNHDNTLANLFEGNYLKIEPPEKQRVCIQDFLKLPQLHGDVINLDLEPGIAYGIPNKGIENNIGKPRFSATRPDNITLQEKKPIQTKSTAWQSILDHDLSLQSKTAPRAQRPIIVFASHIAFAHNLGGISRAAEIFGAESLVVGKASVVNDVAFKGVSVNSHLHLPLHEVPAEEASVCGFLEEQRTKGYSVVGIEQTDSSTIIGGSQSRDNVANRRVFPQKVVLVMGGEKEGIPGWLLAECDMCIEIPQVGVTRSLNVQTATAIALYEYGREWPLG